MQHSYHEFLGKPSRLRSGETPWHTCWHYRIEATDIVLCRPASVGRLVGGDCSPSDYSGYVSLDNVLEAFYANDTGFNPICLFDR
ncbi:hypothetical protein LAY57_25180 [Argonema antarcticum A004/B2]|nr:hypothetical protein [Argonema antarcticum A004/B2]